MSFENIDTARRKFSELTCLLREAGNAVLAFSGGVDSSFLLKAMTMSDIKVLAVTAVSETVPGRDIIGSASFAKELGVEHLTIRTEELLNEAFVSNPPDRCFFCKDELFKKIKVIARQYDYGVIFDGSNSDDLRDYRPGVKAAALHAVRSPLAESSFTKDEIRVMARELGLDIWNRPASPCLSSRFPYGQRITPQDLRRVEEAEEFLRTFGIHDIRVRNHGDTARIETGEEEMYLLVSPANRRLVTEKLKSLGYRYVSLDLEGYISGSMNRVLGNQDSKTGLRDTCRKTGDVI
ncbi:MAG: ATP-dependent sacrificial sulfur transferase LarE [Nitrospirota bacterium]|nr:ATP-dependent sacrificial sulfur transferase LarE [Nitrospirota bacterium]